MHSETLDLRQGLSHFEAQVSHFSTGTAALFGRRLQVVAVVRTEHFKQEEYPDPSTRELIRNGMELRGTTGIHAKGFLIDNAWCGILSANFNPFSLDPFRKECNVELALIGSTQSAELSGYARFLDFLAKHATNRFAP